MVYTNSRQTYPSEARNGGFSTPVVPFLWRAFVRIQKPRSIPICMYTHPDHTAAVFRFDKRTHQGADPMEVEETSVERRDPRRCTAHNRAGAPCGKFSMQGMTVCRNHGGASPQAQAKAAEMVELAELRLRGLAPRAVDVLDVCSRPSPKAWPWVPQIRWWTERSGKPPNAFMLRRRSR